MPPTHAQQTPPPANPAPPATGARRPRAGVLGWLVAGCGLLILLAALGVFVGGLFVSRKARQAVDALTADPAMTAAELLVRMSPELELLASDREARTVTLRHRESGEITTVGLADLEDGAITFGQGEEEVTVRFEPEGDSAAFKVTDGQGNTLFQAGPARVEELPSWVLRYPGAEPENTYSLLSDGVVSGTFNFRSADPLGEVESHFRTTLSGQGYELERTMAGDGEGTAVVISGHHPGTARSYTVRLWRDGEETRGQVSFNGK